MRRSMETAAIVLLSGAALAGSPPAAAEERSTRSGTGPSLEKQKLGKQTERLVKHVGGRILWLSEQGRSDTQASSIQENGRVTRSISFYSGKSTIPETGGDYTLSVSGNPGKDQGLRPRDIDRVRLSEGSSEDGKPISTIGVEEIHYRKADGRSWILGGHTLNEAGISYGFVGGVNDGLTYIRPVGERGLRTTASVMNDVINRALADQPTEPIDSPFGPAFLAK
ncbi:MAG TPA: hypothetical protein VFX86_04790 [Candidatus Saccharimonadales bacterium]|nr:hypothetical protein [Candidatus Saccharimonadales bacterium]